MYARRYSFSGGGLLADLLARKIVVLYLGYEQGPVSQLSGFAYGDLDDVTNGVMFLGAEFFWLSATVEPGSGAGDVADSLLLPPPMMPTTASVINIDPVVSGKHVGIRSSLQEQTRSASARRRSMPDQPTGSIIMNTAVGVLQKTNTPNTTTAPQPIRMFLRVISTPAYPRAGEFR
jgi:hypothetical protein